VKGRKRHIATDVLGLLLAVIVTAAPVADSTAGRQLLDHLAVTQPDVSSATAPEGKFASRSSNVSPHRVSTCCPRGG
ncbi:transposase, partial [Saccharothrix sp. MB29]|nr:transposase [Saccharothrix sp. MB29]